MSVQALTWAFAQPIDDALAKALLVAIANYADRDGLAYPGQETLSQMTAISVPTIKRKLKLLESLGLITRERRQSGGRRSSDLYHLVISEGITVTPKPEAKVSHSQGEGISVTPSYKEDTSDEPSEYKPPIDDFWKIYPERGRKNASKAEARVVWDRMSPKDCQDAITSLAGYRAHCQAEKDWYKPLHPHRYLKTRRFEAFLAPANAMKGIRIIKPGTNDWLMARKGASPAVMRAMDDAAAQGKGWTVIEGK